MCEWCLNYFMFGMYNPELWVNLKSPKIKNTLYFLFYNFYVLCQFSLPLVLRVVIFHLMFWVWIPICCRWVLFLFRYDALVRVFLYYFVWCMDNDRRKCQYNSEQQLLVYNQIFIDKLRIMLFTTSI